jgi:tripartite-type tricarboxylate transporter receptor subunit TctC
MEMISRRFALGAGAAAAAVALVPGARADTYPSKAIRIVVPYPAGAAGDIMARLFGEYASAKLGQPIVVDNRPGGAGIAATDAVAKADPDGYTLLLTGPNHATNVGLYKSLPYDPDKDFAPISLIGTDYTLIMANPKSGFSTIQELIAKAKAKPGTINFSSSGIGTAGHLSMELFERAAGIKLVHIPYRGATPAMTDTVSGQVPLNITSPAPALAFIHSKRLIPLVVSSPTRIAPLPDTPTGKEIGLDWVAGAWFGLTAPAKTPKAIIDVLAKQVADAVHSPKIKSRFEQTGTLPGGDTPEQFQALIRSEIKRWPEVIRNAGIKMQ